MKIIIPVSRLRRLTYWILCFYLFSISNLVYCQENSESHSNPSPTRRPQNFVTGKLNQFNGFYTPRPLPSNANFVYASIWASWSAWSFCANNVQIRVRACNTVRGFTCPGANQERKPCGPAAQNAMRQRQRINNNNGGFGGDYDAVDPWEEDRREALKQLYSDYTPPEDPQKKLPAPPLRGIGKSLKPTGDFAAVQRSAGKTAIIGSGNNGYGNGIIAPLQPPPESYLHKNNHANSPGQAPSMTPEKLFGSKIEIPTNAIKSSSSESKEQRLEGISDERKEDSATPLIDTTEKVSQDVPAITTTTTFVPLQTTTTPEIPAEAVEVPVEGKFVPSTETNQNPLKMGMNHEVGFGLGEPMEKGGVMEDITKDKVPTKVFEESKNEAGGEDFGDEKEREKEAESEVFGEGSVTDILPHVEVTTQVGVTEWVHGVQEPTQSFEGKNLETAATGDLSGAQENLNGETTEANGDEALITSDSELPEQNPGESQPSDSQISDQNPQESQPTDSQQFEQNPQETIIQEVSPALPPKSHPPPSNSDIPPHAAFENEDDSDLMASTSQQQAEQQEQQLSQNEQHFQQPTFKISPSKSKPSPVLEEHETLPKDEMYDDQFEAQNTRTTVSPEDKIKQLEADMDALESQITEKLHSGEVSFNKDTEKALEWMLANMTKAAEEAAARQEKIIAEQKRAKLKHHHHEPPVHSGEITFPHEEHEGETKGIFGKAQVLDNRQFASKISPMDSPITLRKIQPEIQKQHYDSLKYQHAKVIKPIQFQIKQEQQKNPEANLLESDLKKLRAEMAKMESELVALQGDTSIVEVNQRTTIGPNLKGMDLELVPKGPKPIGGPNTPIVTIGSDGEMFLLDVPSEKGEAQWSPWKPWNECFCDKQIRTRVCNYDSGTHSKGCQGKSFESRACQTSRPCPAKTALKRNQGRTTPNPLNSDGLYTLAPQKGPRTGYAFKPNPLSVAISSLSSSSK